MIYYCIINKKICDIFPRNYYKLAESSKQAVNDNPKKKLISLIGKITDKSKTILKSKSDNQGLIYSNPIISDLSKLHSNAYKLRIYKRFVINGSLSNSAIVYNFIKEELRFMTRGYPEDIINKCQKHSIPEDLEETISINRKNGLIVLVCATKLLDIEEYNDYDQLESYMEDLIFCGYITLKNKINDSIKFSVEQINQFNCHMVISSADNEYNCLSAGFNSGIIDNNNNIFVFDKRDNKLNKLCIRKLYSTKVTKKEDEIKKDNKANDKVSKFSRISKNISQNKKKVELTVKKTKLMDNDNLINSNSNSKKVEISLERKNSLISPSDMSNMGDVSEVRKLNDISNIKIDELNKSNNLSSFDPPQNESSNNIDKLLFPDRTKKDNTSINIPKNKEEQKEKVINNFLFFENINYYHGIFDDYDELKNGIYCISSSAFNFLYKNKDYKGIKYILEKLNKNTKIFFNMSSIDKSRLIDYFRESGDNVVCSLGECDSDIDQIISSNVGVSLKNPPNQNMILSHFYSSKKDIICLKNIIIIGRLLYENSILVEIVSFSCAVSVNFFLIECLLKNLGIKDTPQNELRFLDLEFLILELFSFSGSPKEKTNMIRNKKKLELYHTCITYDKNNLYFNKKYKLIYDKTKNINNIYFHTQNNKSNKNSNSKYKNRNNINTLLTETKFNSHINIPVKSSRIQSPISVSSSKTNSFFETKLLNNNKYRNKNFNLENSQTREVTPYSNPYNTFSEGNIFKTYNNTNSLKKKIFKADIILNRRNYQDKQISKVYSVILSNYKKIKNQLSNNYISNQIEQKEKMKDERNIKNLIKKRRTNLRLLVKELDLNYNKDKEGFNLEDIVIKKRNIIKDRMKNTGQKWLLNQVQQQVINEDQILSKKLILETNLEKKLKSRKKKLSEKMFEEMTLKRKELKNHLIGFKLRYEKDYINKLMKNEMPNFNVPQSLTALLHKYKIMKF
mgnify:CR=1 FL=1